MDRITDSQLSEITKLPVKRCNEAKLELVRMNIIKQQGGMFGPNKNISEWCIPQNEENLKRGIKHPSNWGLLSLKTGDTKDTITKEKEKIIRPRILANPLTSQKTIFLWLNRMLQFRAAVSGEQQKT